MTATSSIDDLRKRIERVVQDHIAASRKAAEAAVARGFSTATRGKSSSRPQPGGARQIGRRRPSLEIAALADRLCEAVRASPGETMAVLAPQIGESARALQRPMAQLKSSGRVRSVGNKHLTRYYPLAD
jgi:hypothetical protein